MIIPPTTEITNLINSGTAHKNVRVSTSYGDITNDNILSESLKFTESVCSNEPKFGICERSKLEFTTVGIKSIKGETIIANMEIVVDDAVEKSEEQTGTVDTLCIEHSMVEESGTYTVSDTQSYSLVLSSGSKITIDASEASDSLDNAIGTVTLSNGQTVSISKGIVNVITLTSDITTVNIGISYRISLSGGRRYSIEIPVTYSGYATTWKRSDGKSTYGLTLRTDIKKYVYVITLGTFTVDSCERDAGGLEKRKVVAYSSENAFDDFDKNSPMLWYVKNSRWVNTNPLFVPSKLLINHLFNYDDERLAITVKDWTRTKAVTIDNGIKSANIVATGFEYSLDDTSGSTARKFGFEIIDAYFSWFSERKGHKQKVIDSLDNEGFSKDNIPLFVEPCLYQYWKESYTSSSENIRLVKQSKSLIGLEHVKTSGFFEVQSSGRNGTNGYFFIPKKVEIKFYVGGTISRTETIYDMDVTEDFQLKYGQYYATGTTTSSTWHFVNTRSGMEPERSDVVMDPQPTLIKIPRSDKIKTSIGSSTRTDYYCADNPFNSLTTRELLESLLELDAKFGKVARSGELENIDGNMGDDVSIDRSKYSECKYGEENTTEYTSVMYTYSDSTNGDEVLYSLFPDVEEFDETTAYDLSNNSVLNNFSFVNGKNDISTLLSEFAKQPQMQSYTPVELESMGNLLIETGDIATIEVGESEHIKTYVLNRTINGIQNLQDDISSK